MSEPKSARKLAGLLPVARWATDNGQINISEAMDIAATLLESWAAEREADFAARWKCEAMRERDEARAELAELRETYIHNLADAAAASKAECDKLRAEVETLRVVVSMVKKAHREYAGDGRAWLECRDIDALLAAKGENDGQH